MPRARANIIAKFIAQIETGTSWLISTSDPAEATRPARVRTSGSPAASRAPNARTRIARVTGQENISDFSIASRLALLKSDHSIEAPVGCTVTPSDEVLQGRLVVVGHPHHLVGVGAGAGQQHRGVAVPADGDPGLRRTTSPTRGSASQDRRRRGDRRAAVAGQDVAARVVDDDLDRRAGVAAEVVDGQVPHRDRLRTVGLPAGAGQLGLHARGEDPEADDDQRPHRRASFAGAGSRPARACPARRTWRGSRTGGVVRVGVGRGVGHRCSVFLSVGLLVTGNLRSP